MFMLNSSIEPVVMWLSLDAVHHICYSFFTNILEAYNHYTFKSDMYTTTYYTLSIEFQRVVMKCLDNQPKNVKVYLIHYTLFFRCLAIYVYIYIYHRHTIMERLLIIGV